MLKDLFDEDCERYFSKETAKDQKQKLFKSMQQNLRDRLGTDNTVVGLDGKEYSQKADQRCVYEYYFRNRRKKTKRCRRHKQIWSKQSL